MEGLALSFLPGRNVFEQYFEEATSEDARLDANLLMQRSLRNRLPYIDRDGTNVESTRSGLHMSINGIAAGLRNSG